MKFTDKNKRPQVIQPNFSSVPVEMKSVKQWVLWKFNWVWDDDAQTKGYWSKVPFATNGIHARSNDAKTWSSFESVYNAYEQNRHTYDGVGFMFSADSEFVGVDLDNCVTRTEENKGELTPFALRVAEKLGTYTELSPSGTGVHLIGKAKDIQAVKTRFKENEIEIYRKQRYFTFTGLSVSQPVQEIRDIHEDLTTIINAIKPQEKTKVSQTEIQSLDLSIETRLKMAFKNPDTKRWFDGDTGDFGGDDSRADLALCRKLAYWSDGNRDILDAMFRESKLFRKKWDERRGNDTYGNITIEKVLSTQERYASQVKFKEDARSSFESRHHRRLTVNDLWDLAMDYRRSGEAEGVECGWSNLTKLYRPAKGQFTVVTGMPGSGKSTLLDVYCYQLAQLHGWRFTFASFETLPIQRHILNFAQIATQKPTFTFIDGHATDNEMEEAREFLNRHFHFLNPGDEDFTMERILEFVADDIKEFEIDGFVLDTYTELDEQQSYGETETQHIKKVIKLQQRFTRTNNIHSWTVAHPTKPNIATFVDDGEGGKRPTLGSIGGSQAFWNKIDFGMIVHRPDKKSNLTKVYVDKVRFDVNGMEGEAKFLYDRPRRSYTPTGYEETEEEQAKASWGF